MSIATCRLSVSTSCVLPCKIALSCLPSEMARLYSSLCAMNLVVEDATPAQLTCAGVFFALVFDPSCWLLLVGVRDRELCSCVLVDWVKAAVRCADLERDLSVLALLLLWLRPALLSSSPYSEENHLCGLVFCGRGVRDARGCCGCFKRLVQLLSPVRWAPSHEAHLGSQGCPSLGFTSPHILQIRSVGFGQTSVRCPLPRHSLHTWMVARKG